MVKRYAKMLAAVSGFEAIDDPGFFITFQFLDTAMPHFLLKEEAASPLPVCSSLGTLATGIYSGNR